MRKRSTQSVIPTRFFLTIALLLCVSPRLVVAQTDESKFNANRPGVTRSIPGGVEVLDSIPNDDDFSIVLREVVQPVAKAIRHAWEPLLPPEAKPPVSRAASSSVTFTLLRDGSIKDIAFKQISGSEDIGQAAKRAIERIHLSPFPKEVSQQSLHLRLTFSVNLAPK